MITLRSVDDLPSGLRFALAIGMFDGVHRGHRRVLRALIDAAKGRDASSVVLTFDPHPAAVLRGAPPPLLCDPEEKLARLGSAGVDTVIIQKFDERFADQPPEAFLGRLCAERDFAAIVMTEESAFGRDRAGGLPAIRRIAPPLGIEVLEVPQLKSEASKVSSTRIRSLLEKGRLAEVRRLLGRSYAVTGKVVRGDQRGRGLGYPTANLSFDEPVALPQNGIYAVRVNWGGQPLAPRHGADGVASLGIRPTFGGGVRLLEVHIFDFDGDLYGQRMRVEFARRLRAERTFDSAAALIEQMDRDAARARKVLAGDTLKPNAC